jgi:hypothetical protein
MEDVLHVYSGHDSGHSGSKVTDQPYLLRLHGMIQKPRRHLMEVLSDAELHHGEGNTDSLPDSGHHRVLVVLHQEDLPEVGFRRLMVGGC